MDSENTQAEQAAKNHNYYVIPNEVRNPSSLVTQEWEGFLGERRASE